MAVDKITWTGGSVEEATMRGQPTCARRAAAHKQQQARWNRDPVNTFFLPTIFQPLPFRIIPFRAFVLLP